MSGTGHVRKSIRLSIDGAAYECEVTNVTLTPSTTVQTATALCDDGVIADTGVPSWSLDLDYLVDHNAGSLFRHLVGNVGKVAEFSYEPDPVNAAGVTYDGEVRILPGPAGGESGSFESGSVSLPVIGTPAVTDPAPLVEPELEN
jgi:hypothetical protein